MASTTDTHPETAPEPGATPVETPAATPTPPASTDPTRYVADPGPLGLAAFALTTLVLSLFNSGIARSPWRSWSCRWRCSTAA